ncbi:hypothetical protein [Qipengyuania spongiae]|uniref:Uncharacterized protein n=1 Tax=Qipengyuania spongiae TaxID=2909673 RepID=A0ABY5T1A1_9SPHN|nr:hypothetical protein [Qipengyuania spongiae]UVI39106.1 hypothetical protein L1F33_12850 [Qipengyuania spongiae]
MNLTAVQVSNPAHTLMIASPGPVFRWSQAHFRRVLSPRWMRMMAKARRKGLLHDVAYVTYDAGEGGARLATDGIGRPHLIVGTLFLRKLLASGPDETTVADLHATLGSVLNESEDVETAMANLAEYLTV